MLVSSRSLTVGLSMSKQYSSLPSALSLSGTGGAVDLKTTTVSAHLNFTVGNPTCIFKENFLQGWKYHPVSVAVLVLTPCPMGRRSAVCQLCSGLGVGFQLHPSPWPVCLALSLLEIYSRNRKHETHLHSKGGDKLGVWLVAVDQEGRGEDCGH